MAQVTALDAQLEPHLDPREIIELRERRRRAYAYRDNAYVIYRDYYFGEQQGMGSPAVKAMNEQGRPLLRDVENSTIAPRGSEYRSNRLQPIVDDAQALLGRMPNSRVDPPDPSDQGIAFAEKETKYLISTHELSNMDEQQEEVGWWLPCLGDAMYMLDFGVVGPEKRRVVWQTVDPSCAYPAFKLGHRRYDMLDVILYEEVDPYEAAARFGSDRVDPDAWMVPITVYMSQFQRTVVVGNQGREELVRDTRWNLPWCPAVWVFNKRNGRMGQSDIAQSLIPQDALDYLGQVFLDGAAFATYAVPWIKDPTNSGEAMPPYGAGMSPVQVGPQGGFGFASPQTDLKAIQLGESIMTQEIYTATGTSEVRQEGKLHSSIPTGRAAHALQGPQATRFELKQAKLASAIRRMNSMTLEAQETMPYLGNHTFEIFGREKGQSFKLTFTPKEDINGWYRNTVRWDLVIGMNPQQKTAMAYEALAAGMVDRERAIEIFGEEDPPGMVKRVEKDKMRQAQMEQQLQASAQPGGSPGGAGQAQPGGAAAGNAPPTSPTRIARPYELGQQQGALPTGVPKGVTLDAVRQALQMVADKLKGTVAIIGELAQQGTAQHIEALISSYHDDPHVKPVLRALDPQAKTRVLSEEKWPDEAVRVV